MNQFADELDRAAAGKSADPALGRVLIRGVQQVLEYLLIWMQERIENMNYKLAMYNVVTLPPLTLIIWFINAQGMRLELPMLSRKLWEIPLPLLTSFEKYDGLHDLDFAHILSLVLLVVVWWMLAEMFRIHMIGVPSFEHKVANKEVYCITVTILAVVIPLADAMIFFCGLCDNPDSLWGQNRFVPFMATIAYSGLLIAVAFFHVMLED